MRPAAFLAPAFRSFEPDHRRELKPIDRIKPFVLERIGIRRLTLRAEGIERPGASLEIVLLETLYVRAISRMGSPACELAPTVGSDAISMMFGIFIPRR